MPESPLHIEPSGITDVYDGDRWRPVVTARAQAISVAGAAGLSLRGVLCQLGGPGGDLWHWYSLGNLPPLRWDIEP